MTQDEPRPRGTSANSQTSQTYQYLGSNGLVPPTPMAIRCLVCTHVSYNFNDITQKYCGFCHRFHDDPTGARS